jgi:hypothetical protein
LATILPKELANDLVTQFLAIRRDVASGTLGRAAPGKFVESVVQALQHLERGKYDAKPSVDAYLRAVESRSAPPDDGLRICGARVARAMYTLRNKRNILHKGDVDPNTFDLVFLLAGAQWLLAEFVRHATGISMEEAGTLVQQLQAPVGALVEDYGSRKLVLVDTTMEEEVLLVLHTHYPEKVSLADLTGSMDRRSPGGVRNKVRDMWRSKLIEGDAKTGYVLTGKGLQAAIEAVARHTQEPDSA